MKPEQADAADLGFDPFDATKIWPKKEFPVGPLRKRKSFVHSTDQATDARLW